MIPDRRDDTKVDMGILEIICEMISEMISSILSVEIRISFKENESNKCQVKDIISNMNTF